MGGVKRPSRELALEVKARARELWAGGTSAGGLSFRAVVRRLEEEGRPASLAAIHAACTEDRTDKPSDLAVAADLELLQAEDQQHAEDLRETARATLATVRKVNGTLVLANRVTRERIRKGEATPNDFFSLGAALRELARASAEATKLARVLSGQQAMGRGGASGAAVTLNQAFVLTPAEAAAVEAAKNVASGPGAEGV